MPPKFDPNDVIEVRSEADCAVGFGLAASHTGHPHGIHIPCEVSLLMMIDICTLAACRSACA